MWSGRNPGRVVLFFSVFALSYSFSPSEHQHLCEGFVPENDLNIPEYSASSGSRSGVDQSEYNNVLDKVEREIGPLVSQRGGRLHIERKWSDGTVNAYASRQGSTFVVTMMGGLARHSAMTPDGLAMVACHEVGHHIGGEPRYSGKWASTEGESDYFATLKCLRYLWQDEDNERVVASLQVDSHARAQCQQQFEDSNDVAICIRSAMAGMSGARLFASLNGGGNPQFTTPDPSRVAQTYESHPQPQCRLDTYFQGALCERDYRDPWSESDPDEGACSRDAGDTVGLRSMCWYKPVGGGGGGDNPPPPGQRPPSPALNGQGSLRTTNPNQVVNVTLDVRMIPGATGLLMEVSKPNRDFSNPGGNAPDPQGGLGYQAFRHTGGNYALLPARQLPGWGRYKIRVMALDAQGRAIGNFSDDSILEVVPR